jgi:UPF0176 protein
VNAFLAGDPTKIQKLVAEIFSFLAIPRVEVKESYSDHIPFSRTLVKVKNEIITMGHPEIQPSLKTGDRVMPRELARWLDQGEDLVLLDTRNAYEVLEGTFQGAVHFHIDTFREFPEKLRENRQALEGKKVVMFCTGGIRCEKATAFALDLGLKDVYQLEGGILKYFEETRGKHYTGDCFVFDGRQRLDPNLTGAVDRKHRSKTSGLVLHSYRRCPFAIRVRWMLEEKGLPYQVIEENLSEFSPELLALHPEGRVPLLKHHDLVLYESAIIDEYLEEQFPEPRLMPLQPEARARLRLWTYWSNQIFKPDLDAWKYEARKMTEDDREKLLERLHEHLKKLHSALSRHEYLIGEVFSMADLHVFPLLRQLTRAEPRPPGWKDYPALHAWIERMKARPTFQKALEREGVRPIRSP